MNRTVVTLPKKLEKIIGNLRAEQWIRGILSNDNNYKHGQLTMRTICTWFARDFGFDLQTNKMNYYVVRPFVDWYGDELGVEMATRYLRWDVVLDDEVLKMTKVGLSGVIKKESSVREIGYKQEITQLTKQVNELMVSLALLQGLVDKIKE